MLLGAFRLVTRWGGAVQRNHNFDGRRTLLCGTGLIEIRMLIVNTETKKTETMRYNLIKHE